MTRTELAAIWPPTASAAREAGQKPMSRSGDQGQVLRLQLFPIQRSPALRSRELRPMALQGRQAPLAGRGAKNPAC